MTPIDFADEGRPRNKIRSARFAADRLPMMVALAVAVQVEISRETQNKTHHVVSDHVGKQAPHVAQHAGMLDECVEQVMLETGGRRLDPAQFSRALEQARSDLPEKCVGLDDLFERFCFIVRVHDGHFSRRMHDLRKSLRFDWGKYQQLHGASETDSM